MSSQFEETSFDALANGVRGNHCCFLLRLPAGIGEHSGQEAVTLLTQLRKLPGMEHFGIHRRHLLRAALHCW